MSRKMPINVGSFTRDRLREWVNSFDVVLTDCDGESNYFKLKFPIHPVHNSTLFCHSLKFDMIIFHRVILESNFKGGYALLIARTHIPKVSKIITLIRDFKK